MTPVFSALANNTFTSKFIIRQKSKPQYYLTVFVILLHFSVDR